MIHPDDIRQKALNLYSTWQVAWLNDEPFFPKLIPCEKKLDDNIAIAAESVQRLRAGSKEQLGYGYSIEWKERNSRRHGRNQFPEKILFETEEDFLQLIGKQAEFATFTAAVREIQERFPQLSPWIRSHRKELVDAATELDGLFAVISYLVEHPRPNLFARELPIAVDTKFVERNRRILRAWLDIVLPPHQIRADEDHFDRRFGLRYVEPLILVRFLDEGVQAQAKSPWSECSIPLHSLAEYPIPCRRAVIVENKVNLLTLPFLRDTIAMGGLGNAVTDLRYLKWLANKDIWYWGDIDVEGFEILSRLRAVLPGTQSMMMDERSVAEWRDSIGAHGTGRAPFFAPPGLTVEESQAFRICASENLRIEQERIPQLSVVEESNHLWACSPLN
ncbi:DUF3322 domain-containing protein [Thalassoglobus sp.]|uniref:DUF3322 domain-containing protein n=1 Tax=Thalassoglobus sp. TaxID=2795869 RepID=UPI003AA90D75